MAKKILIACEYSGIVRNAFLKYGYDVTSCDILDTEQPGQHYKGNIFDILYNDWDCLIAFPPCTYLSSAGLYRCNIETYGNEAIQRIFKRNKAIEFFLKLYSAPIKHICIENPLGHLSANILKPTQIINPYYFGEPERKRTALWLKNLPKLEHTKENNLFFQKTHSEIPKPIQTTITKNGKIKNRYFTDKLIGNKLNSAHNRSKTFLSIANAMAEQWSLII